MSSLPICPIAPPTGARRENNRRRQGHPAAAAGRARYFHRLHLTLAVVEVLAITQLWGEFMIDAFQITLLMADENVPVCSECGDRAFKEDSRTKTESVLIGFPH